MRRKLVAGRHLSFIITAGLAISCAGVPRYQVSDHYDGKKFFNPTHPETHGFWDVMKFLVGSHFEDWPEHVENSPKLNLNAALSPDEAAITFVNHATVLVQLKGVNVLTDPIWSERASPFSWIGPKRVRSPGIAFEELPRIDLVLISHNHYDHLDLPTLIRLNQQFKSTFIVPLGVKSLLNENGIENVVEMDWWDKRSFGSGVDVTLTPTQHISGRGLLDRFESLWGSYVLSSNGHRIYFAGDTAYSTHFKAIRDRIGPMDLALLPIGAYEPRWFMQEVHLNPEEAVKAHLDLASRASVGIHFGCFQLTTEKIDQPVIDLAKSRKEAGIGETEFIALPEGNTKIFKLSSGENP